MRLADLLAPYAGQLSRTVECDALGLHLSRYVSELPVDSWPPEAVSRDTAVLATIRSAPQFVEDLHVLEKGIAGADEGVILVLCLEDSFEMVPVPTLASACSRNSWRIVRMTDLAATRVRTGVLVEVRTGEGGPDQHRGALELHNALVLSDYERRRLCEQLEEERRSGARAVTVVRAPTDDGKVKRLRREIGDLRRQLQKLEKERNDKDQERRTAVEQLRRLESSGTVLVGRAFVQAPRRPKYLLRLPWDLVNFKRRRSKAEFSHSSPSASRGGSGSTAEFSPSTSRSATAGATVGPRPYVSAHPCKLRVATVARRSLADRLRAGAEVVTIAAGGWLGDPRDRLGAADVLLVEAEVGSGSGSWYGLGDPGEVERMSELVELIQGASMNGTPSVLLVRDGRVPAGLRALQEYFTVVLPWELGPSGWDPGIPLGRLPWPTDGERASRPLHIMEPGCRMLHADKAWLAALKPAHLQRWIVGVDAAVDVDPGDVEAVRLPTMPFAALAGRSVVAVSSRSDVLVATAALAAGCHVVGRVPIGDLAGTPGLTIAENPARARELLERQMDAPPPDQLATRRRLLGFGSTEERLITLAAMLDLPITGSLRRQVGVSLVASVRDRRSGESLARAVLDQTRRPRDVVVATDEPPDAAWLQELRSAGLDVTLHTHSGSWWQLAATARRDLIAIWSQREVAATELADIELLHAAPDRLAVEHVGGVSVHSRATLAASVRGVEEGMPAMAGDVR